MFALPCRPPKRVVSRAGLTALPMTPLACLARVPCGPAQGMRHMQSLAAVVGGVAQGEAAVDGVGCVERHGETAVLPHHGRGPI